MTTINCALNCQYQKDGKCTLDYSDETAVLSDVCAYFSPPDKQKNIEKAKP